MAKDLGVLDKSINPSFARQNLVKTQGGWGYLCTYSILLVEKRDFTICDGAQYIYIRTVSS